MECSKDMKLSSPLLLFLAVGLSSAFVLSSPLPWPKLILTHSWPSSFCSIEHCESNISHWTLHGLWPSKGAFCNSSWHFNSSEIQDLLPDLKISWPDLENPFSTEFWKYEWHKHGTCAAKAVSLNSQHKYFSKALELYHKVDLNGILKKFNIIPSENYYTFAEIEKVIDTFYGFTSKIQCYHQSKNAEFQTLGQIEICFNPDFNLMDCEKQETLSKGAWYNPVAVDKTSGLSVCDQNTPVYYPPPL
ncbi:ribonuclease T2 isoform X2 [Betta splendens]|nr:ribonuclease T2 isoform X2 [Betta splendens]